MPNKWTFKQPKLLDFIMRHIQPCDLVLLPFAGMYRFDDPNYTFIYNDINEDIEADFHMDSYLLKDVFKEAIFDCIIADPPYTHYQALTSYNNKKLQKISLWRKTANLLLKDGGTYIELGYNSTGLRREIAEKIALGICCNGGSHNDILILVQRKYKDKKIGDAILV